MSYLSRTHSVADAQPVTLYQFTLGDNQKIWRFCNADRDLDINNEKWQAAAISDSGRKRGENITVILPSNNPVAQLYRGMPPAQTVKVTIIRLHYDSNELRVVWIGTILEAKRPEVHQTELVTASLSATMESAGLRLTWGRNCPYTLYDDDCKVNLKNFAVSGLQVTALDGLSITVDVPSTLPDGWFTAGFIEWVDGDGILQVRAVTTQHFNRLSLMGGTQKLAVGSMITVYPGCDGRAETCLKKFGNILNFGGIPHMPNKSPYDGTRVF